MKGQSSMEFLAMVSMSLLILAALYTVMADRQVDTVENRIESNAEAVANDISFQVEMALVQGEGYSRVFSVPGSIEGDGYNVTFTQGNILLEWQDRRIIRSTRYQRDLSMAVNDSNRVLNVKHNESGVFVVEP